MDPLGLRDGFFGFFILVSEQFPHRVDVVAVFGQMLGQCSLNHLVALFCRLHHWSRFVWRMQEVGRRRGIVGKAVRWPVSVRHTAEVLDCA